MNFCRCLRAVLLVGGVLVLTERSTTGDEASDFFERKIRPVLVEHCYECHSAATEMEGGLRVDTRVGMREGGDSGPAVAPNDIEGSLLVSALRYESLEMPPDKKLSEAIVQDFETWIEQGALDPREHSAEHVETQPSTIDYEEGRTFWSFISPVKKTLPAHHQTGWPSGRIDHFVAAALDKHQLTPSSRASSETLLRRLCFDLTGLPPSPSQIERFEHLRERRDLESLVGELLSSAAYGEHFARLWLDVMRFADDQAHIVGNNQSLFFPNSHLYRDWLIDALNRDIPYDEFIRLQLAADLLTSDDPTDDVALGFLGLGPKYYRRNSPEVMADEWENQIDVLSRGVLGLTVACARCHDHKYDPIGTDDYYALAGVFASVEMFNRPLDPEAETDGKGQAKNPDQSLHIVRDRSPVDLAVMIRGDVNRRGSVIPRGYLTVLSPKERIPFQDGSGRLELATALSSPQNPLVARVIVNRVWAQLIGKPLVATPSNFGSLGDRPSHPALLDDLAYRFMENGWSLKWLCREIVTSSTYLQSSEHQPSAETQDPENRWLSHMNRKRLSVEQWRDALLAASGRLSTQVGGENIDPQDPASDRRTVYSAASRLKLNPMLALFDYPDPNAHSARRAQTTTATQKLFLMNSPLMVAHAEHLADELRTQPSVIAVVRAAYQRLFARSPTFGEINLAVEYLTLGGENLREYLHGLMMTNEMFFVE